MYLLLDPDGISMSKKTFTNNLLFSLNFFKRHIRLLFLFFFCYTSYDSYCIRYFLWVVLFLCIIHKAGKVLSIIYFECCEIITNHCTYQSIIQPIRILFYILLILSNSWRYWRIAYICLYTDIKCSQKTVIPKGKVIHFKIYWPQSISWSISF